MASMKDIERKTARYAQERAALAETMRKLHVAIQALKLDRRAAIMRHVERASNAEAELRAAIAAVPELFERPRSRILHGIRVGFQKGKGKIEFADPDRVVALIRKHMPDSFDVLVKTTEKPIKDALAGLTAAELKKLGVTVEEAGDRPLIKPADSEVDRLVAALLDAASEDGEQAA